MGHRQRWINWIASTSLILAVASCDGLGAGCGGCSAAPLPAGGLPADQTLEGGAQIRITPSGFSKITSLIPELVNDALDGGFCLPRNELFDVGVAAAELCGTSVGQCQPGCLTTVTLQNTEITSVQRRLNIKLWFDVHSDVHIYYQLFWRVFEGTCDASFDIQDGFVDIDVALAINASTGQLTLQPSRINRLDVTGISVSGDCGLIDDIVDAALNLFAAVLDSFVGNLFLDLVRPLIDGLLQDMLPDPLGIEGIMDLAALTGAPASSAGLELRVLPGGYVDLVGNGMTLGVITGINADADTSTRTPGTASEPADCVPPMEAPDFNGSAGPLPRSPRGTFILSAAEEFRGAPDPAADVAIGVSKTALDLAGHHLVTSGALCVGLGTREIPELDLGRIGLLVPSLAALGNDDGRDPLLLLTRPVQPLSFSIGEGTTAAPSLTLHVRELEIDFYAFLFERYVRAFTVRLDLDAGVNLEFQTTAQGQPALLPVLSGLDSRNIQVEALNTEFLRESQADLELTLPAVLDLALPLIAQGLGPIEIPSLAGFELGDLQMARVQTTQDSFLAILGTFATPSALSPLARAQPSLRTAAAPARAETRAALRSVHTPSPERIRQALAGHGEGGLPEIVIDVDTHDAQGRRLEWTWNIDGGMWRPFTSEAPLVIRDPALVWQGHRRIEVRARVAGDYRTLDLAPVTIPVVIDSAPPRIHAGRARVEGGKLVVPATDLVTPADAIELAFGHPDDDAPATAWSTGGVPVEELRHLAGEGTHVRVWARDALDNTSSELVDAEPWLGFHGGGGSSGCDCAAGGASGRGLGGLALLAGFTVLLLRVRRRTPGPAARALAGRASLLFTSLAIVAGSAVMPACGGARLPVCEVSEDCDVHCVDGPGVCLNNMCLCPPSILHGRIGQYSDMALAPDGTVWVSAYNSTYGDLTVAQWDGLGAIPGAAWEFVDGVPAGPVVVERSPVRGGVLAPGTNVGKYTSIAVSDEGDVMVSYFDEDNASLKLAVRAGDEWHMHTVAAGTPPAGAGSPFEILGQYSSLTLSQSGRPGIAYFARLVDESGAERTQVRFAAAQSTRPESAADWSTYIAEEAELPPRDPGDTDPLRIPRGVGLFLTSARMSDQAPVLAYYDRIRGALKMSRFNVTDGTFEAPLILDGASSSNDAGWYPSVAVDGDDNVHVTYVNTTRDDLMYVNTIDHTPEIVDDGHRMDERTDDGLPKPVLHLVGDDSSLILTSTGPVVVYQDATAHQLLMAEKSGSGLWDLSTIAGNEAEFAGGFGFYAAAALAGREVVMSSWVVHPPMDQVWVQIFRKQVAN